MDRVKTEAIKLSEKISKLNIQKYNELLSNYELDSLHRLKIVADDLYYNTGNTILSDDKYDLLKETLIKRDPSYVVPIGAKIRDDTIEIKLQYYMGSMDKFKPENKKEIISWTNKHVIDSVVIEEKLDGLSCLASFYPDGQVILATRGNGEIGSDISSKAKYIKTLPMPKIDFVLHVRGEMIIKSKIFDKKYSSKYANARNMVPSLLVTSKHARDGINDVDFIAYEIISTNENQMTPEAQLNMLNYLGFFVAQHKIVDKITFSQDPIQILSDSLNEFRANSSYELDGIIVHANIEYERNTDGNPDYAFAFKMNNQDNISQTTVTEVVWNVSKRGYLKPVVVFEPVKLVGVTIKNATGFNAKFILDNKIGPGAIIKIAQNIVPYILEVVESAEEAAMPLEYNYEWTETGVDIFTSDADSESCIKLIAHFFSYIGIKNINEGTIGKIYRSGYKSIISILNMKEKEFEVLEGFGKKLASNVYNSIHSGGMKNLEISKVLGACGIFGFGISSKKLDILFRELPDIFELHHVLSKKELLEKILNVDGFSDKTAEKIIENINYGELFLNTLKSYDFISFKELKVANSQAFLLGKKVVFSGFRDSSLEQKVVDNGGQVMSSVSKNTSMLVVPKLSDKNGDTSKILKARELKIAIYTKDEFIEFLDNFN